MRLLSAWDSASREIIWSGSSWGRAPTFNAFRFEIQRPGLAPEPLSCSVNPNVHGLDFIPLREVHVLLFHSFTQGGTGRCGHLWFPTITHLKRREGGEKIKRWAQMPKWMAMDDMLRNDRLVIGWGGVETHNRGGKKNTNSSIVSPSRKESERVEDGENKNHVSIPPTPIPATHKGGGGTTYHPHPMCRCDKKAHSQLARRGHGKTALQTLRNARLVGTSCYHYVRWCSHGYSAWCEAILHHQAPSLSCITAETPKKRY